MSEKRGHWYLFTGILIGVIVGLLFTRFVQPPPVENTSPANLQVDYKDDYRILIARAYLANSDLVRAKARLELLGDNDYHQVLEVQAQRILTGGGSEGDARALAKLAADLQNEQ